MRFQILLFSFLIFSLCYVSAQHTISYDFQRKSIIDKENLLLKPRMIKAGDYLQVEVKNYNPFLYSIQVTHTDSSYQPMVQSNSLLTNLFDISKLPTLLSNINPENKQLLAMHWRTKEIPVNNETEDLILSIIERIFFLRDVDAELKKDMLSINPHFSASKYENYADSIVANQSMLHFYHIKSNSLPEETRDFLDSALHLYQSNEVKSLIYQLRIMKHIPTSYLTPPIYIMNDIKHLYIHFIKRGDSMLADYPAIHLKVPMYERYKAGVSAGIHLSGLHSEAFVYKTIPSSLGKDSMYSIVSEEISPVEIGANAIAYYSWRIGHEIYAGLSAGAGVSIESSPKPRILFGGNFLFGSNQRLLISGGLILGYVNRLSEKANINRTYLQKDLELTKSILKHSYFISFNYSLF